MGLGEKIAKALPDPMVPSVYDGDISAQRAAVRQARLIEQTERTNALLQVLIDLQRQSLDDGRLR